MPKLKAINKYVKDIINAIPDARPSKPSIQLKAFITPEIQITVNRKLKSSDNSRVLTPIDIHDKSIALILILINHIKLENIS